MSIVWRKNIFNSDDCDCCSGGGGVSYETYNLASQEIKFPLVPGEGITTNFQIRGSATGVTPGWLSGIKLTKIANVVHLLIPAFQGNMTIGNTTSLMRLVTAGDYPVQFKPTYSLNYMIDAINGATFVSASQNGVDLEVDQAGNIDLSAKSFFWNGPNCGLSYDISVSWIIA